MVSSPSYDPNRLASHDTAAVQDAWSKLNEDPERPLTNRAIGGDLYPPRSAFKLLVGSAALESGEYTAGSVIPGPGVYERPKSSARMYNRGGGGEEAHWPQVEATRA